MIFMTYDGKKYESQLWEEGKLLLYALNKALVYLALPEIFVEDLGLAIEGVLFVLQFLVISLQLSHDHLQLESLDSFRKDYLRIFYLFLLINVVILPLQSLTWTLTLLQQMYLISINMISSLWQLLHILEIMMPHPFDFLLALGDRPSFDDFAIWYSFVVAESFDIAMGETRIVSDLGLLHWFVLMCPWDKIFPYVFSVIFYPFYLFYWHFFLPYTL